ncbi:MAG: FecR domain-containing protein [Gammaproteobacteria bacterium]|nr:FecR domain-containing protein [Gammaproteobacteria bacterium]
MSKVTTKGFGRLLLAALLLAATQAVYAASANSAGTVTLSTGRATAADLDGNIRPLSRGDSVYQGELISTGPSSYLNIKFKDGGRILLRPNSRFEIEQFEFESRPPPATGAQPQAPTPARQESAFFRLLKGGFRAVSGLIGRSDREDYRVRTPVATIGIRGTDFEARMCQGDCQDIDPVPPDGLYTGSVEGTIEVTNAEGKSIVRNPGQYAYIPPGPSDDPVGLRNRPRVLDQDPMPDPETCGD